MNNPYSSHKKLDLGFSGQLNSTQLLWNKPFTACSMRSFCPWLPPIWSTPCCLNPTHWIAHCLDSGSHLELDLVRLSLPLSLLYWVVGMVPSPAWPVATAPTSSFLAQPCPPLSAGPHLNACLGNLWVLGFLVLENLPRFGDHELLSKAVDGERQLVLFAIKGDAA